MAIIDDSTQEVDKKIKELKTIDINDSSLPEGNVEKLDATQDAWERACPPPDGIFHLQLHEAKTPFQLGESMDGKEFWYVANLECKIVDAELTHGSTDWNGTTVFGKVSSYIPAGKGISTMAGLISKMGVKLPEDATHLKMLKLLKKCLAQEPKLYCEGEWKAWDLPKNEWIKQGMKQFPKTEDGKHFRHVVRDSKGGEVVAKWKPKRWFGNKEYRDMIERDKLRKQQSSSNQTAKAQQQQQNKPNGEAVGSFEEVKVSGGNAPAVTVDDGDFIIEE